MRIHPLPLSLALGLATALTPVLAHAQNTGQDGDAQPAPFTHPDGSPFTTDEKIEQLQQELDTLKSQRSLDQEVAAGTAAKAATVTLDKKGLNFASPDDKYAFGLNVNGNVDLHSFGNDGGTLQDEVVDRLIRPTLSGKAGNAFFKVTAELGGSSSAAASLVDGYIGDGVMIEAVQHAFNWEKFKWFTGLPLLVQALMISFIFDFGQYWMHRGMHNWYPLWLAHAPHHYITQLNVNKGAVGNPIELFLIGLGVGGFFDFLPRAALLAGTLGLAVGSYQHINVRFNSPRWWRFLFNTTEHHSLHHSQDYESTRSNFAGAYIFIDRIFGTCIDGEAELLGQEGGRRMSIREQMTYPFTEGWKSIRHRFARPPAAVPAE